MITSEPQNHAWSGLLSALVSSPKDAILSRLKYFIRDAGDAQIKAWSGQLDVLQCEGAQVIELYPPAHEHSAVLEYVLPREGGRRPDVVVLQNGCVVVLEFKETGQLRRIDIDQVAAYARDLKGYHSACGDLDVVPVLVLCGDGAQERFVDGVQVIPADQLAGQLISLAQQSTGPAPNLSAFLKGEYAPLPTLVAAARLLFQNLPLPFIKRARSAGVHDAVECIIVEARRVREDRGRCLVLVTGVPGAGKTLVGLQVAHSVALEEGFRLSERRRRGAPATFLSGNGPLVQVLQQALKSTTFVQDMHRFIREHGLEHPDRVPSERLIVFDEAQRAWDREKIEDFYTKKLPEINMDCIGSEPDLLVRIADQMPEGAVVVALVGQGQEIHTGEEAGMEQWAVALARSKQAWSVLGPPNQSRLFQHHGIKFNAEPLLNLDVGLRYHAGSDLHRWVESLLDKGDLETANTFAKRLREAAFPIYVTRDLNAAKSYARARFAGESLRRYGLLASSKSERHLISYGLETGFQATKRLKIGDWFNAEPIHAQSCCQLNAVATEFQCQGLELDLAVVCWANDFWWGDKGWVSRQGRRQKLIRNPHQLRVNAYRVLLTRGREGLVLFVPPTPEDTMDPTFNALLAAGAIYARGLEAIFND